MPKVTSHTGVTQAVQSVPNSPVYESNRVVEDWELMKVAQGMTDSTEAKRMLYQFLHNARVDSMLEEWDVTCQGRTEGIYRCLLAWKEKQIQEALLGTLAKGLHKHGFKDLAESFPP